MEADQGVLVSHLSLFHRPLVRFRAIDRPRLFHDGLVPLTLVFAPAGYGKSTVLSQWGKQYESLNIPTSWLLLGNSRVSPDEFWRLFATALGLEAFHMSDVREQILGYVEALEEDVVVVIDNYEHATCASLDLEVAQLLGTSPHIHVTVSGRRFATLAGPMVTARYSTYVVTAEDLAMAPDDVVELAALYNVPSNVPITAFADSVAGWPLPIQAACTNPDDPERQLATLVAQYVQVACAEGAECVLHAVALCEGISVDALSRIAESWDASRSTVQELCELLEDLGLIVKVSMHDGDRYACHRGILRVIQDCGREAFSASEYTRVRQVYASDIENRDPVLALKVLLELGDFDVAEQLARQKFIVLLTDIRAARRAVSTVAANRTSEYVALDALRLFADQEDPVIGPELRWKRMKNRQVTMRRLLEESDADSVLYVGCSLMTSENLLGHTAEAYQIAVDLDRRLNGSGDCGDRERCEAGALIRALIGFSASAAGDFPFAERNYLGSLRLAEKADSLPLKVRAYRGLSLVNYCLGDLAEARRNYEACRALEKSWLDRSNGEPLEIADITVLVETLAGTLSATGWPPEVELQPVPDEVMKSKVRALAYPLLVVAETDVDRRLNGEIHAMRLLQHRVRYWPLRNETSNAFSRQLDLYTADLFTVTGDLKAAKARLDTVPDGSIGKNISLARIYLFQGDPRRAVDELGATGADDLVPGLQLDRHLQVAIALWLLGNRDLALDTLLEAERRMRLTEKYSVLAWVPYAPLLEFAEYARDKGARDFYEWVCAVPESLRCLLYEALSRAELRSLVELANGWPLDETADALYISINTLKFHLRSIYRKLHVSSRNDALIRGQALGLLTPRLSTDRDRAGRSSD